MAVQWSPCKLFDRCVSEILQSLALSEKAAVYLPQNVCYYILHKACQDKNLAAVEKIVSAWSYPTLSFNFQLYPLRSESSHTCLLAPEYADVYSSEDLSPCITSIAIGLFNNVYRRHVYCDTPGGRKRLQEVDLSNFHASFDNMTDLQKLVMGEFPGKHASDYLRSKDKKALNISRPCLPPPHSDMEKIKLLLSLCVYKMSSLEYFSSACCTSHFQVLITGLDFLSLGSKTVLSNQLKSLQLCNLNLLHFKVDPSSINDRSLPILPYLPPSCVLSFIVPSELNGDTQYVNVLAHLLKSVSVLSGFFTNSSDDRVFDALLSVSHCQVKALGIVQPTLSRNEAQTNLSLVKFLQHNSKVIEYLQLRPFFLTTVLTPLLAQLNCANLRVLSVDSCGQSSREREFYLGEDIFPALCRLCNLEYFEWAEVFNLRTVDIMALYRLLSDSLPKLQHWHMYLNRLLLSTTDLDNVLYVDLLSFLVPMLEGKVGDESCTTYKFPLSHGAFVGWLQTLRHICFKTGTHRDCPSVELQKLFPWLGYY